MVILPTSTLAGLGVVLGSMLVADTRRWWSGSFVASRLGRPDPRPVPALVDRLCEEAGVDGDRRLYLHLWLAAVGSALLSTAVTPGGLIASVVVAVGPPVSLVLARGRGARLRAAQVPDALDVVAGSLRGGAALTTAVDDAAGVGGRLGREFATMARHARDGLPLAAVVAEWSRTDDPDTALAGAALTLAAALGGPGADAVEAAATSLRERAAIDGEVAALSVQARLSAAVLTLAPIGFAFLLVSLDPTSARFLLATPAGWACITIGVALDAIGALWMHRLVRGAS